MEPLVSIVLPIYNGEKYMRESIESILSQTWTNWELIIMDDCSTDSTAAIAQEYGIADSRIHYYCNTSNLRLPKNLNAGFQLAHGEFLTWTSDDNVYLPNAIEKMVGCLLDNGADFVFASYDTIDTSGNITGTVKVSEDSVCSLVGVNTVGACFLYSRKAQIDTGEYNPNYTLVEDFDYWQRMSVNYAPKVIKEVLYRYRFHDGALTSTMKKEEFNNTLEKMLLTNRPLFGKLDFEQSYYYYLGLSQCRTNLEIENPYAGKLRYYKTIRLFKKRIPAKIKRMLKGKKNG